MAVILFYLQVCNFLRFCEMLLTSHAKIQRIKLVTGTEEVSSVFFDFDLCIMNILIKINAFSSVYRAIRKIGINNQSVKPALKGRLGIEVLTT